MSDEEINIKIAEYRRWTRIEKEQLPTHVYLKGVNPGSLKWAGVPDYCNDLNAIHGAVISLGDEVLYFEFEENLAQAMGGVGWITHATARQQAEAFLKTIGQ